MSQRNKALQWALIGASDIAKTRMIQAINAQPDSRVAAVFSANKHAPTGFEVHGTEGSLMAVDVMTQDPRGRIVLRRDGQETEVKLDPPEDLYAFAVRHFNQAVRTGSQPFATGEDGLRSLAVGLAALESSRIGQRTPVRSS